LRGAVFRTLTAPLMMLAAWESGLCLEPWLGPGGRVCMKLILLRYLLMVDSAVLFLLGALLICVPRRVEAAFHFGELPPAVSYLIGLWGCVFVTMGVGYVVAATHPIRHRVWVQVGIARGALECVVGVAYLTRGVVTWQQAAFGIVTAAVMTGAYVALYPRGVLRRHGAA